MNRVRALRVSLLVSMGLLPLACGEDDGDEAGGQGGNASKGGTAGKAGSPDEPSSGAGAGGEGRGPRSACTSPTADPLTGLVLCAEGYRHRPEATTCGTPIGEGGGAGLGTGGGGGAASLPTPADGSVRCNSDDAPIGGASAEDAGSLPCIGFRLGYCDTDLGGYAGAPNSGHCASGCVNDHDCEEGFVCVCGQDESPSGGACRPSNCATDADCDDSFLCSSLGTNYVAGFACQSAGDECAVNDDCAEGYCDWSPPFKAARFCNTAVPGRPFLVDSTPRLAPISARRDWNDTIAPAPRVDHLSVADRQALAEHWTRSGQMEHASIAAFARFSLQLLSLGAPPSLIEDCTQALADETAHTRLCFQLASAYAGRAVGPGPLDIEHSLEASSLLDIVDLVLAEGCLGETVAALEALESADAADDPVLRAAYTRIAKDEQDHAALAFRFVRWALKQDGIGVRARVTALLRILPGSRAARSVVEPCLVALLP